MYVTIHTYPSYIIAKSEIQIVICSWFSSIGHLSIEIRHLTKQGEYVPAALLKMFFHSIAVT